MGTERWNHNGIRISTYASPAADEHHDRRRIQITVQGQFVQMDMDEWTSLVRYARLVGTEPHAYEWLDREYDRGIVRDGIMTIIELGKAKNHHD